MSSLYYEALWPERTRRYSGKTSSIFLFLIVFLGTSSVSLHFLMLISESSVSGALASCSTFLPLPFCNGFANLKDSGSFMESKIACWATKSTVKMAGRIHLKRYLPGLLEECEV